MGAPPRSEAECERVEKSSSMEEVEGKTVERVAMDDKFSIRRASIADSRTVGIRYSGEKDGGLENRCCGGEAEEETRGRMERRRLVGRNIFMDEEEFYKKRRKIVESREKCFLHRND